jgi:hypothetical protein
MKSIVERLAGGDLRSLGNAQAVERALRADPSLFGEVFAAMSSADPRVRMRAADVIEKVTRTSPQLLQPFRKKLIREIAAIAQQEVRWHAAQMFPRLKLSSGERKKIIAMLFSWVAEDASGIVRVMSLQALADLSRVEDSVRKRLLPLLAEMARKGSPALRSRSRRLLRELRLPGAGRVCR